MAFETAWPRAYKIVVLRGGGHSSVTGGGAASSVIERTLTFAVITRTVIHPLTRENPSG